MAKFTSIEYLIAAMLSATPVLKRGVKKLYVWVNSVIYKKNYKARILVERIPGIMQPFDIDDMESFFGYYDKNPDRGNKVVAHLTCPPTFRKPCAAKMIQLAVRNIDGGEAEIIAETASYTWQQGARSQWLNDDLVIFNVFDGSSYLSKVYSVGAGKIVRSFGLPVQDASGTSYFLSLNYRRLMRLRPDYGYRNMPPLTDEEMSAMNDDGIWKVDYDTGETELVWSLEDIVRLEYKPMFAKCHHKVNHIMINEKGDAFVFIHRSYHGGRRFDRLIYSDFKTLKVLADDDMVSHCCWLDNNTLFGYFRCQGKDGYYFCNVMTGDICPCHKMTELQVGDGHPSSWKDWIVFDSYPDKSRMQHLYLYDRRTDEVVPLLELYHSTRYSGECRCDLHPRFSQDGRLIFFDSVYNGRRQLCYVDVSSITYK